MTAALTLDPRFHDAVLFDLDSVVTDTAGLHQSAWKTVFDDLFAKRASTAGEDHAPFTDGDYRRYFDDRTPEDGVVGFLVARKISMPEGRPTDDGYETVHALANREQRLFVERLENGVGVRDSTIALLHNLREAGIATALVTTSDSCERVLRAAGLLHLFPVRIDGEIARSLGLPGKPHPAAFLEAAARLEAAPARTVVVDDGQTGVVAGRDGGFALVIGVDRTGRSEALRSCGADAVVSDLGEIPVRSGFRRVSALPNALHSYGHLLSVLDDRQPVVFVDFDFMLTANRDSHVGTLEDEIRGALASVAAQCPVAVFTRRSLDDIRARIGIPELWYAAVDRADILGPDGTRYRPGTGWSRGEAMAWICDRVRLSNRRVPFYLGAELIDEFAFDAVRCSGVGIVIRTGDNEARSSAAQFALDGAGQMRDFLWAGGRWLGRRRRMSDEAWLLEFNGYDPASEKLREALCTSGNGYFATRGCAPEAAAGQVHYPGTYAAGVYNRLGEVFGGADLEHESLVNLPNWLPLTFRIESGDWFDVDRVSLLSYRQTLDLRSAVLTRALRFRDSEGRITAVTQQRFIAMNQAHIAALYTTLTAENWSGEVEIQSTVDAAVVNCGVERYRDLASRHLALSDARELNETSVLMTVRTTQSQIPIAVAARTTVREGPTPVTGNRRLVHERFQIGHEILVHLDIGRPVIVEKVVSLVTGRDVATSEPAASAARILAQQGSYAELHDAHRLAWAHIWGRLAIEIDGHVEELRILRLHLLHLMQTVSRNSLDLDVGVPARGLHGEAYRGHVFWDELFVLPVLNLRFPTITRALLRYRHRRLSEARRAAKLAGYTGAMFPWQSGSDGREESPTLHLNPRSGRWISDSSHLAHHIGIAVAYNVWQFYQVTGDLAYLIDYAAELLVEIARFWVSRVTYDPRDDRYSIRGVIGPDEFHSGYPQRPSEGVDNNAYTNVMAVWVIMRAFEALELLPLPNRLDLREKLTLTDDELANWADVSRRMFVPFHDGVISQFEGYGELAEFDWGAYRTRYGDIRRLDRILEAEDDDINKYKVSKQADVLMLLYLLSSDELCPLLSRLGYDLPRRRIPEMVDYYMKRNSHGSTLSAVVHSWVLARANRDHAMDFFRDVLRSDVDDIQGGTTSEGIHLAAMAGSVDLLQRCFTGLEVRGNRIVLSPQWPATMGALGFPIHYRGHHLYLRVSGRGAEVSAAPRDVPPIVVECRGRIETLSAGCVVKFDDVTVPRGGAGEGPT